MSDELARFLAERSAGLAALDMDYARKAMPTATDEVRLISMHKARYECTDLANELRHSSAAWLREHGYGRLDMTPLLPEGELPE